MASLNRTIEQTSVPANKNDLAKVLIRSRRGPQSGDVKTVQVSAVTENVSQNRKIPDYVCTMSVPSACVTLSSVVI